MSEQNHFNSLRVVTFADSTLLSMAEYDPVSRKMRLHFRSTNSVWEYEDVWPSTFGLLIAAHSVGKHFNHYVRPYFHGNKVISGLGHRQVVQPIAVQTQLPL